MMKMINLQSLSLTVDLVTRDAGGLSALGWRYAACPSGGCSGTLREELVRWKPEPSACVVMVAGGYPGAYEKGHPIGNIEKAVR